MRQHIYLGSATAYNVPDVSYWNAIDAAAPGTMQASQSAGWDWETILSNTTEFLQALVVTEQQRNIIKVNLERAKQGLPPVSASDVGMGVSVGLDDKTRNMIMIGGAVLVAALVYVATQKRRG
jgi:predicted secreted hydrolase